MSDIAKTWLEALASRGVRVEMRGNRLALRPATAYRDMTDAEVLVLRHHRQTIKALVAAGFSPTVGVIGDTRVVSPKEYVTSSDITEPCKWCNASPCVGASHPFFLDLHPLERQSRDNAYLTTQMYEHLRRQAFNRSLE